MTAKKTSSKRKSSETISCLVDAEECRLPQKTTPRAVLIMAKYDPSKFYLIQIEGDHEVSYKDKPDKTIRIREGNMFVTAWRGVTPIA